MFKVITMLYIKLKYRLDFFISYYCAYQLQKRLFKLFSPLVQLLIILIIKIPQNSRIFETKAAFRSMYFQLPVKML